jgi:hypothetical protein
MTAALWKQRASAARDIAVACAICALTLWRFSGAEARSSVNCAHHP